MTQENSHIELFDKVHAFVMKQLEAGEDAAVISYRLAEAATLLGLSMAPSSEHAMVVVMDGVKSGCALKAPDLEEEEEETSKPQLAPADATFH